jgi:predicted dehydrogenase
MSGKVFHGPFFNAHAGFELYGVWERSKKQAAETYPSIKSFDSYEELLADDTIKLVVVNTPNSTHYHFTKLALNAGKHVLVEKPFVPTAREAAELFELANSKGLKVTVYQNRRFDSEFLTIKKLLQQGLLGDVVEAEIHFDRFKEELSPKAHKEVPGIATGVLYDLGSHLIDQALQLFGMPEAVFADIDALRPISKVEDYFELLLLYPWKRVRLKATYVAREPAPSYVLHGTKGSFLKQRADVQETDLQSGLVPTTPNWGIEPKESEGLLHTEKDGKVVRELVSTEPGNYMLYFNQLYQGLVGTANLPVSQKEAVDLIKIIEAAYASSNERRVVDIL